MKRILSYSIITLSLTLFLSSCKNEPYRLKGETPTQKIEIKRLEVSLFGSEPAELAAQLPQVKADYAPFMEYFGYVIGAGDPESEEWNNIVMGFATDKLMTEVYSSVISEFSDVSRLESELGNAFGLYSRYFPEAKIPAIYSCITGFNNSLIVADSVMGISLDRYLGKGCKFYPQLGLYDYQVRKMTPANIVSDIFYAIASSEFEERREPSQSANVLSNMIYEGKLIFFIRCMIPDTPLDIILGYTPDHMKFCIENEGGMWDYLVEKEIIFSSEQMTIRKVTGEAPFTGYFSNASPGRAGVWLGYRIVESYMRRNPETTLNELMRISDYQSVLEGAKYRPGK